MAEYCGQNVYLQYWRDEYGHLKVGQTIDVRQRSRSIGWIDRWHFFEDCSYAEALFIESYLRMRFFEYANQHPALEMRHIGNDYFVYNRRYYGIMKDHFIRFYEKWVMEAYEMVKNYRVGA